MQLHFGANGSPRLLAPGQPDWIGTDGEHLGWAVRDRLFLWHPSEPSLVHLVALPDLVDGIAARPDGWVVALGQGFVTVDPAQALPVSAALDDDADPVRTHAGRDVGLLIEVPLHRLIRLTDGAEVPLPDGGAGARLIRPWASGVGAVWVDAQTVYRMGERVWPVGRAVGAETLAVGPGGALLVGTDSSVLAAAPRGLGLEVHLPLDVEGACFSPDGARALAATADGAVELDLETGQVVRRWSGPLQPVGWLDGPCFLHAGLAAVVDADGRVLLAGFGGVPAALAGSLLVGPGGRVWALGDDTPRGQGLLTGAVGTDGVRIAHADATHVHVTGLAAFPHGLLRPEVSGVDLRAPMEPAAADALLAVTLEADVVTVMTQDGEEGRFSLPGGALLGRRTVELPEDPPDRAPPGIVVPEPGEESIVRAGSARWPLPADGAARVEGGWWVWTDDGMLAAVQTPAPRRGTRRTVGRST